MSIPVRALVEKTIEEQISIYEVESEIIRWAKWQAGDWLKRYRENPRGHWTSLEAFDDMVGLIGEKVVEATLQQLDVLYLPAESLFPREDPRANRAWDLKTDLGTIDVKTVPPIKGHRRALIRCDTYQDSDYVVAVKLFPEIDRKIVQQIAMIKDQDQALDAAYDLLKGVNRAVMYGWLTREDVKSLPVDNFGKARCWWTFLENNVGRGEVSKLRPMCEFFDMLLKAASTGGG